MFQNFCEFASDYPALLHSLRDPLTLTRAGKIVQFPFSQPAIDEKTEEEQARLAERRKEQGKRLQEMAAKARMEKVRVPCLTVSRVHMPLLQLESKEKDLRELLELRDRKPHTDELEYIVTLHPEFRLIAVYPDIGCSPF